MQPELQIASSSLPPAHATLVPFSFTTSIWPLVAIVMVQCSDGSSVSILIANQAACEYQVEETTQGMTKTYTCYIEAREGDEFEIKASELKCSNSHRTGIVASVDGEKVDETCYCHPGSHLTTSFRGYRVSLAPTQTVSRAFTFGRMDTTNDESVKKSPLADQICTIRVEISAKKRIGGLNHVPAYQRGFQLRSTNAQHEDSKAALWGISAKPGRQLSTRGHNHYCSCTIVDDPTTLRHIVIFKYLSHEWLVAKGLKECSRDDGAEEVAVDIARTERTAARRRARQQEEFWTRNNRVKRESTALSQATTIKEESETRQIVMVDLTGDGDFVPQGRKFGGIIVIEDD